MIEKDFFCNFFQTRKSFYQPIELKLWVEDKMFKTNFNLLLHYGCSCANCNVDKLFLERSEEAWFPNKDDYLRVRMLQRQTTKEGESNRVPLVNGLSLEFWPDKIWVSYDDERRSASRIRNSTSEFGCSNPDLTYELGREIIAVSRKALDAQCLMRNKNGFDGSLLTPSTHFALVSNQGWNRKGEKQRVKEKRRCRHAGTAI